MTSEVTKDNNPALWQELVSVLYDAQAGIIEYQGLSFVVCREVGGSVRFICQDERLVKRSSIKIDETVYNSVKGRVIATLLKSRHDDGIYIIFNDGTYLLIGVVNYGRIPPDIIVEYQEQGKW